MGMDLSIEIEHLAPGARLAVNGVWARLEAYGPSSYRAALSAGLRYDDRNVLVLAYPERDAGAQAAKARIWLRVSLPSRARRHSSRGRGGVDLRHGDERHPQGAAAWGRPGRGRRLGHGAIQARA
jgi:hypothetical protein